MMYDDRDACICCQTARDSIYHASMQHVTRKNLCICRSAGAYAMCMMHHYIFHSFLTYMIHKIHTSNYFIFGEHRGRMNHLPWLQRQASTSDTHSR